MQSKGKASGLHEWMEHHPPDKWDTKKTIPEHKAS